VAPDTDEIGGLAAFAAHSPPVLNAAVTAGFAVGGTAHPRRIALWGDSHVAAGAMAKQLVQSLRDRGETVENHFLPPTMGRANVRLPIRKFCIGDAWTTTLSYTQPRRIQTGPALVSRTAASGEEAYLWLDLRGSDRAARIKQLRIVYRPGPAETVLGVIRDNGAEESITIPAAAAGAPSAVLTLSGDPLLATVKLRVNSGSFEVLGMILDHAVEPAVTFDVFGLPSSMATGWANADPGFLAAALHGVDYDAVILEYGTNEANAAHFDRDRYTASLTRTLTNLRQVFPAASCLLIGPPDRGVLVVKAKPVARHGRRRRHRAKPVDLLRYSRIVQTVAEVQAEVAPRFGCAVWDWQQFMGGLGSVYGWAHHSPPLMGGDLTHMTAPGYRLTASAIAQSLGWTPVSR
jgi:hypothetical protein